MSPAIRGLGAATLLLCLESPGMSAEKPDGPAEPAPRFVEVTEAAGLSHPHAKPLLDTKLETIMPWMTAIGAAAAAADFDRDGWVDLYVTSSRQGEPNHLYRNQRDGTFRDVAHEAGLADVNNEEGLSMAAAWGDFDNDGWSDLYLVRWGRDLLFRNKGNGTFSDQTQQRFVRADGQPGTEWKNGASVLWFDYDRDGRLDLYVGNYFGDVDLTHLTTTEIMHDDFETARNGGRNQLFHQLTDGRFVDVAPKLGVDDPGWTLAAGSADLNNDGWSDLYVANDFGPDQLFINQKDGTFKNVSSRALGIDTKKGMNVDFGDINADGWLDIYVTNITTARFLREGNMMWLSHGVDEDGEISFTDTSAESGTFDGGWGWGAKFFDADLDGDLDLFSADGFVSAGEGDYWLRLGPWRAKKSNPRDAGSWPAIEGLSFSGFERKRFWINDGTGSFVEAAKPSGLDSDRDGRGVVVLDYDNDGDLDLFLSNQGQKPQLFQNQGTPMRHWLRVVLEPTPHGSGNRDGVGTRVTAYLPGGKQIRERDGGTGFASQSDPRLHFGLGPVTVVPKLEIRWSDGETQVLENAAADQTLTVQQHPPKRRLRDGLIQPRDNGWWRSAPRVVEAGQGRS